MKKHHDGEKLVDAHKRHPKTNRWMQGAVKHPGAETAAAKRAGQSVHAYAEAHKNSPGIAGKRARLALTFEKTKH